MQEDLVSSMFVSIASLWDTTLGHCIFEFGSMSVTDVPSTDLTPCSTMLSRRHFPYIITSHILGHSFGIPSIHSIHNNVPP